MCCILDITNGLHSPRFSTELSSGLLEVISPPASYYPDLTNLKETFGDSKERVRYGKPPCFVRVQSCDKKKKISSERMKCRRAVMRIAEKNYKG